MNEWALQCQAVCKTYRQARQDILVLRDVHLTVPAGQRVAIVGASGSGKSTLLHVLGGLERATSGSIHIQGTVLAGLGPAQLGALRNRHVGFIYQFHHLLPEFTAQENAAMPLWIRGVPRRIALEQATALLEIVGLGQRLRHKPGQLSGGERQRVALCRALITKPALVLADEPTGNLDRRTAEQVWDSFLRVQHEVGAALVLVTHDLALAERCDVIYALQDGVLMAAANGATVVASGEGVNS